MRIHLGFVRNTGETVVLELMSPKTEVNLHQNKGTIGVVGIELLSPGLKFERLKQKAVSEVMSSEVLSPGFSLRLNRKYGETKSNGRSKRKDPSKVLSPGLNLPWIFV